MFKKIFAFFMPLDTFIWTDDSGRVVVPEEETWFWGFNLYPLVSYFYLDEVYAGKHSNMHYDSRFSFVKKFNITDEYNK